jgi:hypothetical protein
MISIRSTLVLSLFFLFLSCNRYNRFEKNYAFTSASGQPDYSDLDYWAAHPWKWDPSDSIPQPLRYQVRDSVVDVFFLHPTTFTRDRHNKSYYNAPIDDAAINAKTDYSSILLQATAFNQHARVFAPRYRQAHIGNFFSGDTAKALIAFDTAYADVRESFEYYLKNYHQDRPIIIAAHSQGSLLAQRLLKDYFENTSLTQKLVVAYVVGWALPKDFFSYLRVCEDSVDTGCICSWRTLRNGYVPSYLKNESGNSYATNPLTWTISGEYADKNEHKGSILRKFNKIYKHTNDARISNGFLYIRKPKFPWSFIYVTRNYHIGDINLFYINIRENIDARIRSYFAK